MATHKPVLLDTDVLSDFLRGDLSITTCMSAYLKEYDCISLSVITYYEIVNGLLYKDAKKQLPQFEEFISLNKVIPLNVKSARITAQIQSDLKKKGRVIGHTDTLIAGTAISYHLSLVTNNAKHFKRVKGLDVLSWK